MVKDLTWDVAQKLIIIADKTNNQDGNLTETGTIILTSRPHGRQCSECYSRINEMIDMIESVNPNTASLSSADFSFMMKSNWLVEDICI